MKEVKPKKKRVLRKKISRRERGVALYGSAKIVQVSENEYRMQSASNPTTFYTIAIPDDKNELGICTCPDYQFNCLQAKEECKHISCIREFQKDLEENLYHTKT